MKILFDDVIQYSDAPAALKSPSLAETGPGSLALAFDRPRFVDAIGIGNTGGAVFTVTFDDPASTAFSFEFSENGLYVMPEGVTATGFTLESDAEWLGRLGAGRAVTLLTAVAKQPALVSTAEPRNTLSGQVIPGAGGYMYRAISVDTRYKTGPLAMREMEAGFRFTGAGYPFFIDFDTECYKLPFRRLYAADEKQRSLSFEGGVPRFLYSRRFDFREAF